MHDPWEKIVVDCHCLHHGPKDELKLGIGEKIICKGYCLFQPHFSIFKVKTKFSHRNTIVDRH